MEPNVPTSSPEPSEPIPASQAVRDVEGRSAKGRKRSIAPAQTRGRLAKTSCQTSPGPVADSATTSTRTLVRRTKTVHDHPSPFYHSYLHPSFVILQLRNCCPRPQDLFGTDWSILTIGQICRCGDHSVPPRTHTDSLIGNSGLNGSGGHLRRKATIILCRDLATTCIRRCYLGRTCDPPDCPIVPSVAQARVELARFGTGRCYIKLSRLALSRQPPPLAIVTACGPSLSSGVVGDVARMPPLRFTVHRSPGKSHLTRHDHARWHR